MRSHSVTSVSGQCKVIKIMERENIFSDSRNTFMVITRDYKQLSDQLFIGLYNHILVDVQIGGCFKPRVAFNCPQIPNID